MLHKNISVYLLSLSALLLVYCGKPTSPGAPVGLKDLYNAAVFDGWTADSSSHFVAYDGPGFFQLVDGGAQLYVDNGVDSATTKRLTSADSSKSCIITIMDFGTLSKSSAMFNLKVSKNQASTPIPSFNPSEAVALSQYLGNILTYAHFDKYYFEIQLTGYADSTASLSDAALMLAKFKSKIL